MRVKSHPQRRIKMEDLKAAAAKSDGVRNIQKAWPGATVAGFRPSPRALCLMCREPAGKYAFCCAECQGDYECFERAVAR